MSEVALLCVCEEGCQDEAGVRLTDHGQCELTLGSGFDRHSFSCSISALINVGLGARTHLASERAACSLSKTPGGVKVTLTPWGGGPQTLLIPLTDYANALSMLSEMRIFKERITLR